MTTDRERAIAEIVSHYRLYMDRGEDRHFDVLQAVRKLADIEDPPLPNDIEVLMTRRPALQSKAWPNGWGYAYALDREDEMEGEEEVYRVRITPLERVR